MFNIVSLHAAQCDLTTHIKHQGLQATHQEYAVYKQLTCMPIASLKKFYNSFINYS